MFHRFLILLIVGWQFASQLATVPHVHAGMETEDRQPLGHTPHVHLPLLGGNRHEHHCQHEAPGDQRVDRAPCWHHDQEDEHDRERRHDHDDCGVIFVESHDGVVSSRVNVERSTLWVWNLPLALTDVAVHHASVRQTQRMGLSLDEVGDGSDVYLTLRNLRI
ncbi:MAG: hypothetical protein U0939_09060 [Pirellulales bacterium]